MMRKIKVTAPRSVGIISNIRRKMYVRIAHIHRPFWHQSDSTGPPLETVVTTRGRHFHMRFQQPMDDLPASLRSSANSSTKINSLSWSCPPLARLTTEMPKLTAQLPVLYQIL